mmetsp:Transcript_41277/g.124871  ORF Transcript_41277/g.124871 Transcript_41277/m.124871 type:complete len:616 (-) Transcript_41277:402-2249(-)|eukprot:CAMPEP_0113541490 /NCGR_PEP_ID=MMETSP0015_2-20120614/9066_1 /TAXON_ID=2838 /ORGANISM="Odontella" /LENGTH=615 /DNA_ID=CAMNT_0000441413 /DNA_START=268 /DNA_END=2115 /DNA_ORIENTATION=+ /assembly_acc=CAM_ASM_000160
MDAVVQFLDENPAAKAGIALLGVVLIALLMLPKQGGEEKKEEIQATAAAASTSKKSKKKKAAAASREVPAAKETPAPTEPKVEAPAVVEEAPAAAPTASKKKKKKKKKKGGGGGGGGAAAPATKPVPQVQPEDDDDDDDEDDFEVLLSATQRAAAKKAASKKAAKKAEKADLKAKKAAAAVAAVAPTNGTSDAPAAAATSAPVMKSEGGDAKGPKVITMKVASEDVPAIIGPKGATIQNLQTITGAKVDIDRGVANTASQAIVKITGSEDEISFAYEQIAALVNTAEEERRKAAAFSETLKGDDIKGSEGVKAVIGRGGKTIQGIQDSTGVKVDADVGAGSVTIVGPTEEAVKRAVMMCRHAVFGEAQDSLDLGSRSMVMCVYGKDYSKIRSLQDESGAKLDIDKGGTMLHFSGSREAVAKARAMVDDFVALNRGKVIEVEESKVGAVFGKGGTNLRKIQDRTGTFIDVGALVGGNRQFSVVGPPDAVAEAESMFAKSLSGDIEAGPGEVRDVIQLGVGTPAVIGRGGARVNELEKAHGVKIAVESASGRCQIVGKRSKVDAAKVAIDKIVEPLMEEERIRKEAERMADEAEKKEGEDGAPVSAWGGTVAEETGW